MSKMYTYITGVGSAEICLSTDDAEFMEWYITKGEVHYAEEKKQRDELKKELIPPQERSEIIESFTNISKYSHSVTVDIEGNISLKSNGYTINGVVCRVK